MTYDSFQESLKDAVGVKMTNAFTADICWALASCAISARARTAPPYNGNPGERFATRPSSLGHQTDRSLAAAASQKNSFLGVAFVVGAN